LVYLAYGLTIGSALPLPGLLIGNCPAQVEIRLGKLSPPPAEKVEGCYFYAHATVAYLYWHDVGAILVREGREIILDLGPGAVEQEVNLAILGPAMAILLHQRGLMPLHASAVAIGGEGVAFIGESGLGKSSLAAACYGQGYRLVTDDLLAVELDNPGAVPLVFPGFAQIRLAPKATFLLNETPDILNFGHPQKNKLACRANRGFINQPLPLRRIYVLSPGRDQGIGPLALQEAFIALVGNTYRLSLVHPFYGSTNLINCASLSKRVPIRRLFVKRSLNALLKLVHLIEEDLNDLKPRESQNLGTCS